MKHVFILLGAVSLNKESDALKNAYFEKAIQIIQMEDYQGKDFSVEDITDSDKSGKIKSFLYCS